jgi:hypothetical protein
MALAETFVVPFWYVVEDASLTVTFRPADVETMKLDLDTLATVPAAPPAAGPDRALDGGLVVVWAAAVLDGVEPALTARPPSPPRTMRQAAIRARKRRFMGNDPFGA